MDRNSATTLLSNLLERALESEEKTFLTQREISALHILLTDQHAVPTPIKRNAPLVSAINIDEGDIHPDAVLCIDFGTSFSKACVTIPSPGVYPRIVELPIGKSYSPRTPLITPSEMILDGGTLYFGSSARRFFDDSEAAPGRLIDSMKQYMTLGQDVANLAQIRMSPEKDPEQRFSQRDILVLFLAHLTRLTENALVEQGLPIDIRRRFAHPAWDEGQREKNQREMAQMLAGAILLARSLGDQLLDKMPSSRARSALDQLEALFPQIPLALISHPVREATAAGAGALLGQEDGRRRPYLILDVGAGTTDIAGCVCVTNPAWDHSKVWEIGSAAMAVKDAGNTLDNALIRLILHKSALAHGSPEYNAAHAALMRAKRLNKEQLFDSTSLVVSLPAGGIISVTLDEFLLSEPVVRFTSQIRDLIGKGALAVAGDLTRVSLVATGGGARLPMVRQIADEGVTVGERTIHFDWREPAPAEMAREYPDLVDPYPQIAVALGGSLPELPEQQASLPKGIFDEAPKRAIEPMYRS